MKTTKNQPSKQSSLNKTINTGYIVGIAIYAIIVIASIVIANFS